MVQAAGHQVQSEHRQISPGLVRTEREERQLAQPAAFNELIRFSQRPRAR